MISLRTFLALAAAVVLLSPPPTRAEIAVPSYESAYEAPASGDPLDDRLFFIQSSLNGPGNGPGNNPAAARLEPPLRVDAATPFSPLAPEITLGFLRRRAIAAAWEGRLSWGGSWMALERREAQTLSGAAPRTQLLGVLGLPLAAGVQWRGWKLLNPFAMLGLRPTMVLSPRSVIADRVSENHLDASLSAGLSLALGSLAPILGSSEIHFDWTFRQDMLAGASIDLSSGRWMATLALPWE